MAWQKIINKEMQKKPDLQVVSIVIPPRLLSKTNAYLLDVSKGSGEIVSLPDLVCEALDIYMCAGEEDRTTIILKCKQSFKGERNVHHDSCD